MSQYVYFFGDGKADGTGSMKETLGGKGAGLAEMVHLGVPVPPGFTIATDVCRHFMVHGKSASPYPDGLDAQVDAALAEIERVVGARFGDAQNPLLVSVRSGARVSMPGMMDTVLNLGLNDRTVAGLATRTGDERFAWDSYRRFVNMYGDVVLGLKPETKEERDPFEVILEAKKEARHVSLDTELRPADLKELVAEFKAEILRRTGNHFPEDPREQLWGAIRAVFGSWDNPRAVTYRRMYNIPGDWGTAVTVQSMVFGNMGSDCATGVAFTRDPSTGEPGFFGEFLVNAQGEDVVAGIRTPSPVTIAGRKEGDPPSLEELMPAAFADLTAVYQKLEKHYRDMQDIEFTIQRGKLWMLQTRNGKRTARAMVRIAVEMADEGLITHEEAVLRMDPSKVDELLHPALDPKAKRQIIARGLPASPGAAVGKVVFHADEAEELAGQGEKVILVRIETSPEDIHGMKAAQGIVTARGGMTSHAAVVARGMGKCCVAGCGALAVDYVKGQFTVTQPGGQQIVVKKGDVITLDGGKGEVILGRVPMVAAHLDEQWDRLMTWADQARRLRVRANADTVTDAETARHFGAEGIGLCRTEHMFFEPDRILAVREMILSDNEAARRRALEKILPMQRGDFAGLFKAMDGLPVTIRLLDPPLHEFLPHQEAELKAVAAELGVTVEAVTQKNHALAESNPMLGFRGCRLAVAYPEIYEMQVRAIIEAACEVAAAGVDVHPEIMIPIVAHEKEYAEMRALVLRAAAKAMADKGRTVKYTIGTMIELPRACVAAGRIAAGPEGAEFFSFGTNDLTQTALGISRDDAGRFLPLYVDHGIYPADPFVSIDREGVGALMKMAVERGRGARDKLKIGICGEHGGDPSSVEFCHGAALDYVSCSPFRVPIARLAAAQAALRSQAAK